MRFCENISRKKREWKILKKRISLRKTIKFDKSAPQKFSERQTK